MNSTFRILFSATLLLTLSGCNFSCDPKPKNSAAESTSNSPHFDENYAYDAILKYEKFGPKIPGNDAHIEAGNWIVSELTSFGLHALEQKSTAITYDKKTIPIRNIIAQFNPDAKTRYLLSAHWDNRPFADEDPNPKYRKLPVPGVNDGGSGVVVLLGIAKALSQHSSADIGVDLLFLDAEDLGNPASEESYCLGTQHWAKNPVPANYQARFGINFDMVGRIGSVFPVERLSAEKGAEVYKRLHAAAKQLGYQDFFPRYEVGPIVDDHVYLMKERGFPVIDLIYMTPDGHFPPEWHTHDDTSDFISRDVLKVVGQTTLQALFNE
jgi:Zn-dependent M28 family amino/carboxypeptidase